MPDLFHSTIDCSLPTRRARGMYDEQLVACDEHDLDDGEQEQEHDGDREGQFD